MVGTTSGMKVSFIFILSINCTKPSAVTCVGIIMIIRMKVNMNLFNLKSYAWIA